MSGRRVLALLALLPLLLAFGSCRHQGSGIPPLLSVANTSRSEAALRWDPGENGGRAQGSVPACGDFQRGLGMDAEIEVTTPKGTFRFSASGLTAGMILQLVVRPDGTVIEVAEEDRPSPPYC